jgi:hypothetical protein
MTANPDPISIVDHAIGALQSQLGRHANAEARRIAALIVTR